MGLRGRARYAGTKGRYEIELSLWVLIERALAHRQQWSNTKEEVRQERRRKVAKLITVLDQILCADVHL